MFKEVRVETHEWRMKVRIAGGSIAQRMLAWWKVTRMKPRLKRMSFEEINARLGRFCELLDPEEEGKGNCPSWHFALRRVDRTTPNKVDPAATHQRWPINLETLQAVLDAREEFEDVGGMAFLAGLYLDPSEFARAFEHFAGVVRELARERLPLAAAERRRKLPPRDDGSWDDDEGLLEAIVEALRAYRCSGETTLSGGAEGVAPLDAIVGRDPAAEMDRLAKHVASALLAWARTDPNRGVDDDDEMPL